MKSTIIYEFKSPSSIFYPCNINQYKYLESNIHLCTTGQRYSSVGHVHLNTCTSLHYGPKILISRSCSSQHLFIFALRAKDIHQEIIHLCTTGQRYLVISSFRTEDDEKYFKENESSETEGQIVGICIQFIPTSIIPHKYPFWSRIQK